MPRISILFSIILLAVAARAQSDRIFSADELRTDLQFHKTSIETYNPALGIFHNEASLGTVYDSLYNNLTEPMTDLEFFPYLVRLAAAIREGHMRIGAARDTISTTFRGFFDGSFKYFPVTIEYVEEKARVWGNFSPDSTLQRGDQILRINGEPVATIIERLEPYAITDGNIVAAKRSKVVQSFPSYYFWFYDRPQHFEITFKSDRREDVRKVTLPALNRDSMIAWRDARYGKPQRKETTLSDVYELTIQEKVAHLRLKSFNRELMERFEVKPKRLYESIFKKLSQQNVEHLILDLRGNTGGRKEYAQEILPFLIKNPREGVVLRSLSWKGRWKDSHFPQQSKWAFQGMLYVLTNTETFSNGSVVAAYAAEYGDAVVIGEETASRFEGFAAGSRQWVTLPHTRIPVGIPRYLFVISNQMTGQSTRNRGVLPDYPVTYTWEDLLEERDRHQEKVDWLINGELTEEVKRKN